MNIEQLRQALRNEWMNYYCNNREWLVRLGVWVNCEGTRRPSSSFILATLTALEPQLTRLMPLMVDLNSSPDRIVATLGLNFNPDELADDWAKTHPVADIKLLASAKTGEVKLGQRQYSVGSTVHLEESVTVPSAPPTHRSVHQPSSSASLSTSLSAHRSNRSTASATSSNTGGGANLRAKVVRGSHEVAPYRREETNDIIGSMVKPTTARSTTVSAGRSRSDRVPSRPNSHPNSHPASRLQSSDRSSRLSSSSFLTSPPDVASSSELSSSDPLGLTSPSSTPITPLSPPLSTHQPGKPSPERQDEYCFGRQWDGTDAIWR